MMIEARLEDLEFAAKIVRKRLGTVDQAAKTCGVPVSALEAHLSARSSEQTKHKQNSVSSLDRSAVERDQKSGRTRRIEPDEHDQSMVSAEAAQETTDYFVFYLEDERWLWKRVDEKHTVVKSSQGKFDYYLDCVADARPHGFTGKPLFIFAESDLVSKSRKPAAVTKSERQDDHTENSDRPAALKLES
jgi:hypothetical protein